MNPILRNILAVIAGIIMCLGWDGGFIALGEMVIPPPEGMDPRDLESVRAHMPFFQPKHFIVHFLAHALGSLFGAMTAAYIATSHKMKFAIAIGLLHLLANIAAAFILPKPAWFMALDLIVAYIPMAYLGGRIGGGNRTANA